METDGVAPLWALREDNPCSAAMWGSSDGFGRDASGAEEVGMVSIASELLMVSTLVIGRGEALCKMRRNETRIGQAKDLIYFRHE